MKSTRAAVLLVSLFASAGIRPISAQPGTEPLIVFAASDLGPALTQLESQLERAAGGPVTLVFGSTGLLAQQIRNGAPADVFFAANESFVDSLAAEALTVPGTRTVYARGRIAIVTLKDRARFNDLRDLVAAPVRRVALANPQHAPYGLAAKQALEAAGLWQAIEARLVFGENVQQAVQFVRSGSADAGIVARSVVTPDLHWQLVDEKWHAPLSQAAVVLARSKNPAAGRSLVAFVAGAQAGPVMRQFGFMAPGAPF